MFILCFNEGDNKVEEVIMEVLNDVNIKMIEEMRIVCGDYSRLEWGYFWLCVEYLDKYVYNFRLCVEWLDYLSIFIFDDDGDVFFIEIGYDIDNLYFDFD